MKKRKYWYVKWEGTTVYETWYDDSCYFDNNEEALDFIIKLKKDENIKRIELAEHTVWYME